MRSTGCRDAAERNVKPPPGHRLGGFLTAQFLGAFNDNVYKIVLSLLAVRTASSAVQGNLYLPLIGAVFILPFFLCSGYAGHLADVLSKRRLLIATKVFEVVVMSCGLAAFWVGRLEWMLGVLFLMALQSTFFSPAKYGILPEILPPRDLSRANGWLEMSTFVAIILGTAGGSMLFTVWQDRLEYMGLMLVAVAIAGAAASLHIPQTLPSGARKTFSLNPWGEIIAGIKRLYQERPLWLCVLGIAYFWFLGALLQMDLIVLGKHVLGADDLHVGLLQTFLALGIGLGSMAAGRLSGDKVELGLVPLGALGMGVFALLLAACSPAYPYVAAALMLLGFSGGLFIVPLQAFVQHKSGVAETGRLLATSNFLSTAGILLASGAFWLCSSVLQLAADRVVLLFGCLTLLATVYVLRLLPDFLVRFLVWMLTHTVYRIRIVGQQHVPLRGPALLVANHVSFVDGLLVGACIQRFVRFIVHRGYYEHKLLHGFFRLARAIPIAGGHAQAVHASLEQARQALCAGHVVCIFAEGAISRTGNLLPFKRGFERIADGLDVPIIPVHLDRVWGSIFSFKNFENSRLGKWWPRRLPYPVTVSFGPPLPPTATAVQVRQQVMELASAAVAHRRSRRDLLPRRFIATAKRQWSQFCMADTSGKRLTYGRTLISSLLLARWLRRQYPHDTMVGLLLPASVGGALANLAVSLAGKTPVNLNFTAGRDAMLAATAQCHIQTVLSARRFLRQAHLDPLDGMVYLEDLVQQMTWRQKVTMALACRLLPTRLLQWHCTPRGRTADDLATVMFSSGSTGTPKGVMLSHHNILSNIEGMEQVFRLTPDDRMMGVLPLFHAFGFTVTLWLPLLLGAGVVYHPNPLDAKTIGQLVRTYRTSILLSTPTFCGMYLRQCVAADFDTLRYVIVGAEKLQPALARAFKDKYGIALLEGYGCTEMAPVVAVNMPNVEYGNYRQIGMKSGTVGHSLPGVVAQVVHPESGAALPPNTEGLLLVKGPNRMLGYLEQPDATADVLRDGWYVTGDIACIDADGFIRITDRLTRFSKIGGEMVPHIKVEEALNRMLGEQACLVTAVPDVQKGEQLVVLYTRPEVTPDALRECLRREALPKLWLPKREHFFCIEAIPVLGSGKTDLQRARAIALKKASNGCYAVQNQL